MDPNANLQEQSNILAFADAGLKRDQRQRLAELRRALDHWLQRGGFGPDWTHYPNATAAFKQWQRNQVGRTFDVKGGR